MDRPGRPNVIPRGPSNRDAVGVTREGNVTKEALRFEDAMLLLASRLKEGKSQRMLAASRS